MDDYEKGLRIMRKKGLVILGMCGLLLCACGANDDGDKDKDDKTKKEQNVDNDKDNKDDNDNKENSNDSDSEDKSGDKEEESGEDAGNESDNKDDETGKGDNDKEGDGEELGKDTGVKTVSVSHFDSVSDETDYSISASSLIEGLVVVDEGYDKLQQAVKSEALEALDDSKLFLNNAKDYINSVEMDDYIKNTFPWNNESKIKIVRSDTTVLSYLREDYSYEGGAHPNYAWIGHNFDTATGKELKLSDICKDYTKVCDIILSKVSQSEKKEAFGSEWEDAVRDSFKSDDDNEKLNWIITDSYVDVYYNPYSLGPYLVGIVEVRLSFDEYKDLFKDEYVQFCEDVCVNLYDCNEDGELIFRFDPDGDGKEDVLKYLPDNSYNEEEDYYYDFVANITLGDKTIKGALSDNGFNAAYVMRNDEGKYYLYVETNEYNDWHNLQVFDINDVKNGPKYLGIAPTGSFYSFTPNNSKHITLEQRLDFMGTFSGYRDCYIREDGMIVPYDEEYKVFNINYEGLFKSDDEKLVGNFANASRIITALTDVKDVKGYDLKEGKEIKESMTIKKGTRLCLYATDGENYMKLVDESNNCYIVEYDKKSDDDFVRTINGVDENELFDGIMYAG